MTFISIPFFSKEKLVHFLILNSKPLRGLTHIYFYNVTLKIIEARFDGWKQDEHFMSISTRKIMFRLFLFQLYVKK